MKYVMQSAILLLSLVPRPATLQERWSKEWEERIELTQPSEKIMDAIGVEQGMTVAEIGAGNGRLAVWLARRVGASGKVFANDIDPKALDYMRKRVLEEKISNLIVVEGGKAKPELPRGMSDVVIFANTLHMVEEPVLLLKNIIPALKRGGILAMIEADKEKLLAQQNRPMTEMVPPKSNYVTWLLEAAYSPVGEHDFLLRHLLMLFRVKAVVSWPD